MAADTHPFHFTLESAKNMPIKPGMRSAELFTHGSLSIRYYAPDQIDQQTPHPQDEIYVIASGNGYFKNGDHSHRFGPGDVIFVNAGVDHRFYDFSDDFATWVAFYGIEGGERA